ncbi:MAG: RdgB/HAM1 family non-canonical purine NTP pyrophosphatase [Clostridia bacterium]|nr:RdgB/HAM1 family non-canonical purine NTP pyrophosphatase [Clostridia bacterium]
MDFLAATHNVGKRDEIQRILEHLGIRVLIDREVGVRLREPEENGTTFEENAAIKAKAAVEDSGMPCIADDSGLVVDALGGRPGVYTARYGGEELPFPQKIEMLLGEMDGVPEEKRTARFVSAVVCAFPDGRTITVRGECEGIIGFMPYGEGGFGFDPIFYYHGKSFASLPPDEKDAVSHRGSALRLLVQELENMLDS